MRGSADYALILMSDLKSFKEATGTYRNQYRDAIGNLLAYLRSIEMPARFLLTDPLAEHMGLFDENQVIATVEPGDVFFMQRYCIVKPVTPLPLPRETAAEMRRKFPIERGIPDYTRLQILQKRAAFGEKAIINASTAIFVFGKQFRPKSKPEDGRAVFFINQQFIPTLKLSGFDAPIASYLQVPYGNLALSEWRVESGC